MDYTVVHATIEVNAYKKITVKELKKQIKEITTT